MQSIKIKTDIKNFTHESLSAWLYEHQIETYRAGQVLKWIYQRQADSFEVMTDIKKETREFLSRHFTIDRLEITKAETSSDGCKKYQFTLSDGKRIESVLIPEKDHYTLCISSQVGCALGCRFCLTGKLGLSRNLTMGEILAQIRDIGNEVASNGKDFSRISNIVFMGMGEPLANYENVVSAIRIIVDSNFGMKISTRRVTVSTAGIVPRLYDLGSDTEVNVAISLNATDDKSRNKLMPINKTYPLEELINACIHYNLKPHRKIMIEYILIRGINDSLEDAKRLVKILHPINAKINLIPFNAHEKSEYKCPDESTIQRFRQYLMDKNYTTIVRYSKGTDISAACGQLGSASD